MGMDEHEVSLYCTDPLQQLGSDLDLGTDMRVYQKSETLVYVLRSALSEIMPRS